MQVAHELGLKSSATMMFGHVETIEDRVEHLRRIRDQQDRSGGFTAFICWTFQPQHTVLKVTRPDRRGGIFADAGAGPDFSGQHRQHPKLVGDAGPGVSARSR